MLHGVVFFSLSLFVSVLGLFFFCSVLYVCGFCFLKTGIFKPQNNSSLLIKRANPSCPLSLFNFISPFHSPPCPILSRSRLFSLANVPKNFKLLIKKPKSYALLCIPEDI